MFVYPKDIEQYQDIISKLYSSNTLNVTFQVTDACNLSCTYCYQINKGNHSMPFKVAQKFIDMLLENDENTKQYVDTSKYKAIILEFIGGEPFLEVELIEKILDYFQKRTIELNHPWQYYQQICISSNGTLYFKPEVQHFIRKYKDKISLNISIDGNKKLHDSCRIYPDGSGSYDEAIAAVHHYRKVYNGYMGSKMTLAPDNIQYTGEAIIDLIKEGYTSIFANCIFEKGWTNEHATIYYNQLKIIADYLINNNLEEKIFISIFDSKNFHPKDISDTQNWCGGNGIMISIDYKGDIYPCIRYMESSLGNEVEPIIIGNINTGMMTDAKCRNCINKLKAVNRISQSTQECIECPIAEGCSWCQALNYQESGDFNHRATNICCMHKAAALANCYYWNLVYWKYNENIRFKLWLSDDEALKFISNEELQMLKNFQQLPLNN